MADKGKKAKGGGARAAAKKAPAAAASKPAVEERDEVDEGTSEKVEAGAEHDEAAHEKTAHDEHAHDEAAHDDHGHAAKADTHDHDAHGPNYREYAMVFVVLAVLTVLEVAVTKVPGISHHLRDLALVGMALTKAAFVGLFYMHLKHETKVLKLTVALPLAAPTIYALVLISEAAWRLTR